MIGGTFPAVLTAAQQGDEDAFSVLWRDGNPPLLRYLRVIAPESAEDIAAEVWVSVIRALDRFRGGENAWRAWLFTTARRRAADARRRQSRRPESPVAEVSADGAPLAPDTADLVLENLSTQAAVSVVASLPPLQAEVIMLRVVAGLDVDTVARMLGRNPGAIRAAAHRGLRRLAETVPGKGVTL